MSIGSTVGTALLIGGGLSAAGGVASSLIGSNAAETASQQQVNQENKALQYTQQVEAPFVSAGTTSVNQLMTDLQNGTFGPGSNPSFTLPTASTAEQTPGFQFAQTQGDLGIERAAASAGGGFTGGTAKALAGYNTGLASTTYQNSVANALSAYQANLAKQAQEYQQLITPTTIGSNAASGTSTNVSNLMSNIGTAQAAGTVGSANAISSGLTGATNSASQALLLNQLFNPSASFNPGTAGAALAAPAAAASTAANSNLFGIGIVPPG